MANYNSYIDGTYDTARGLRVHCLGDGVFIYRKKINFASQSLNAGDGDVLRCIQLPAGALIINAWIIVHTAAPTNSTVDLGYGGDVDCWVDGGEIDAIGGILTEVGTALKFPQYFVSADTIDIKATTDTADVDIVSGIIDVCALVALTGGR